MQAERGQELAHEIGGVFVAVDVTKTEQIEDAVNTAIDLGPLRALVNSAGVAYSIALWVVQVAQQILVGLYYLMRSHSSFSEITDKLNKLNKLNKLIHLYKFKS
jgi:NAD(P)-dependent dehydrogenase (short-subunit alcohol dehydrogenase family)